MKNLAVTIFAFSLGWLAGRIFAWHQVYKAIQRREYPISRTVEDDVLFRPRDDIIDQLFGPKEDRG